MAGKFQIKSRTWNLISGIGSGFLVVWLADLHHGSGGSKGVPVCQVDRLAGRLEIELFGCASLARAQIAARREAVGAAEAVRLLYVAATRAEDRLVLAGLPGTPGKTGSLADLVAARVIAQLGVEGELDFHTDPCHRAYCKSCDLETCAVRAQPFTRREPLTVDAAVEPDKVPITG